VQALNPPHRLQIRDLAKITLSGSQVRMPKDDLADNFNRSSRSRGIGGPMPPEIMGPQADSNELSCFLYHHSRRRVGNGKDLFLRLCAFLPDVFA